MENQIENHFNEALDLVHDDYFNGFMTEAEKEAFELGFSAGLKAASLYPSEMKPLPIDPKLFDELPEE